MVFENAFTCGLMDCLMPCVMTFIVTSVLMGILHIVLYFRFVGMAKQRLKQDGGSGRDGCDEQGRGGYYHLW